ncbi:MAG: HDIG domain-containing protein [Puniceicoccales bacterium]|jgi:putative nucleotidyltransferase with HDIG domain|nr:HDIG domain-containing protein [Puniceicoccales bacterium]
MGFLPFGKLLLFLVPYAFLLSLICFSGQVSFRFHVSPGQTLSAPIVAEFPFSFESTIQTQRQRERKALQVAPVYKLEMDRFQEFRRQVNQLESNLDGFEKEWTREGVTAEERRSQLTELLTDLNRRYGFALTEGDLRALLEDSSPATRRYLIGESLDILQIVMSDGIIDFASPSPAASEPRNYFLNVELAEETVGRNLRTQEDALLYLRIHLGALDERRQVTGALFHILRHGIYPNLTYDKDRTDERKAKASSSVKPVSVAVESGETIVPANSPASSLELEKLRAYRVQLRKRDPSLAGMNPLQLGQFWETFAILLCATLLLQLAYGRRRGRQLGTRLVLLASLLMANLLLLRFETSCWTMPALAAHPNLFQALPFLSPLLVGVILVSLELGRRGGVLFSVLLDIFFTLMVGKDLSFFVCALLAMLLAVYQCYRVTFKSQILRVGTLSGLLLGLGAFWISGISQLHWETGLAQALGALGSGLANGLLAIFLLGHVERLFRLTSNVRLQELSDFNHRLLRQLQLYAPGTYHHSLMVANVAEQAALEVGANGPLCRVAAYFHDVGKISHPEYFIENQTNGNPHGDKAPRISSLIIKSHVRDGVEIARAAGVPIRVVQVMAEHHGTTRMQYFYNRACQLAGRARANGEGGQEVDEGSYRYEGPRPQSLEAVILMLVDSCEAASRSLRKVTPQSVEHLVHSIFQTKIEDGQLDDCAITFQQVKILKKSIATSLVNMLHSRIGYAPRSWEETEKSTSRHREGQSDSPEPHGALSAASEK